ncbi:MAG: type II toxin-antitoxin system HipA family toxin [Planctomycetaceae bacterium]|nr:type II toxin-antitoxin system HipA family toxin [Planctomycetales bacterium]MCB9926445.1 type II toxin-antitoxin system HipA family toxin [Planctomycetaceae bacterium]
MSALLVRLGDVEVGVLEHFDDESQRFTFSDDYCSALIDLRPVLGQIFEDRFPHPITVGGPICWFAHLLPQGVMRRWRSRLLGLDQDDTFGLLRQLGTNMPGAVTLTPTESKIRSHQVRGEENTIASKVDEQTLRFSLAGAQWKLSARSAGRGLTTAAESIGTAYIAKFHAPEFPGLPQCEFATMNWARHSGLELPAFELRTVKDFDSIPDEMPVGDGTVFVIERFDRTPGSKIHIEDFGQILDRPPGDAQYHGSYEELASVIKWIAPESAAAFIKLTVFNVICGNGDAHLKNYSVMYPDKRNAALTPAYDLVSTLVYYPPGKERLALTLGGTNDFRSITESSFEEIVRNLGIDLGVGETTVKEAIEAIMDAWNDPCVQEQFTRKQIEHISAHHASLTLLDPQ